LIIIGVIALVIRWMLGRAERYWGDV